MQLRLTLVDSRPGSSGTSTELLVDASPQATFGELRPHLDAVLGFQSSTSREGIPSAVGYEIDGRRLADEASMGSAPLLRGAVVAACSPLRPRMPSGGGGLVQLRVVGGAGAGESIPLARGEHIIGRSASCSVRLHDAGVSRAHSALHVTDGSITVLDLEPANTSILDGRALPGGGTTLMPGSLLRLGSTTVSLRQPSIPPVPHGIRAGRLLVHVRPRFVPSISNAQVDLPEEPRRPEGHRLPLLTSLVPLVLSGALALAMRSPLMLLFALMSPVLLLGQWWSDQRHGRLSHRRLLRQHHERLLEVEAEVEAAIKVEARLRHTEQPDLALLMELVEQRGARLWERRPADDDWLVLRVGTSTQPSRLVFTGAARDKQPVVPQVPAAVDLQGVGVVGISGSRSAALSVAGCLLAQAASWHSPRYLRVVLLSASHRDATDWRWARWLPHLLGADESASTASIADGPRFGRILTLLRARLEDGNAEHVPGPPVTGAGVHRGAPPTDTLVVLDGARRLRTVPGMADLLRLGPGRGMAFICVEEDGASLPSETAAIVEVDEVLPRARLRLPDEFLDDVTPDLPSAPWLERMGRLLAPLSDATPDAGAEAIVPSIGFRQLHRERGLDPLDPGALAAAWTDASGSPRALLGRTASGPLEIDLTRDGPHVLVGGTTGSGKSELLQSLVAGLAVTNRPDDLSFVLIDYKGGAAFRECARLPHTVGLVTDLDEHLTVRALASLTAELRRRERLLAAAEAKDLDAYRARRGRPGADLPRLARLVIVVDEFKMLADELPDFVAGLVRIAATGRSLGVHLVLATQRPAGIVTGDMRANISLRISLRVRDRADSEDVIECADAALLGDPVPGRAYLRAGGGALVGFQTAHVGAIVRPATQQALSVSVVDEPGRRPLHPAESAHGNESAQDLRPVVSGDADAKRLDPVTELASFVEVAGETANALGSVAPTSPWLPQLPAWVSLADLGVEAAPADPTPIGLVDLPHEQRQGVATWDPLRDGHIGVIGGPRSGRTTLVRTLVTGLAERHGPMRPAHPGARGHSRCTLRAHGPAPRRIRRRHERAAVAAQGGPAARRGDFHRLERARPATARRPRHRRLGGGRGGARRPHGGWVRG